MHERFQFVLSKDEYVVGLTALTDQLGRQDTSRTPRLIEQLAVFVGVMAIIIIAFPDAVLGILVAAVLVSVATTALQRRWLRGATGQSYDAAVAEQEVVIGRRGNLDQFGASTAAVELAVRTPDPRPQAGNRSGGRRLGHDHLAEQALGKPRGTERIP